MTRMFGVVLVVALLVAGIFIFRPGDDLVIYSGRSKALVEPVVERFEAATGYSVSVRYGETAQLAVALMEEGSRSPADLFWGQDAGALGALHSAGFLSELPQALMVDQPAHFRNSAGTWVATSGRARVLAFSSVRLDEKELPASVFDISDERWRGRIGWAPTNGSFQSFVTAMREVHGEERTKDWLESVRANNAQAYNNNNALIQAIAAGEIDLAITNHYYLLRYKKSDPAYPIEQTFFDPGDIGNLVNVAGIGMLSSSERRDVATDFIGFLLTPEIQQFFVSELSEYPATGAVRGNAAIMSVGELVAVSPDVNLDALRDLERTLQLLREVGLL